MLIEILEKGKTQTTLIFGERISNVKATKYKTVIDSRTGQKAEIIDFASSDFTFDCDGTSYTIDAAEMDRIRSRGMIGVQRWNWTDFDNSPIKKKL